MGHTSFKGFWERLLTDGIICEGAVWPEKGSVSKQANCTDQIRLACTVFHGYILIKLQIAIINRIHLNTFGTKQEGGL